MCGAIGEQWQGKENMKIRFCSAKGDVQESDSQAYQGKKFVIRTPQKLSLKKGGWERNVYCPEPKLVGRAGAANSSARRPSEYGPST